MNRTSISGWRFGGKRRGRWRAPHRIGTALALSLALVSGACDRATGPDVIVIVIDTLRADHVGALGAGEGRTPIMDSLATDGVLFEWCFSQYPLTLPSISTMLASQWPNVHRVRENYDERLGDRALTLAEVLKSHGYATGAFVSSLPVRAETGCAQGFDVYDDDFSKPFEFYRERFAAMETYWTGSERRGNETVDRALEWYAKRSGPSFLFVHLFDPHSPYDPPEPYASRYTVPYVGEVAFSDALVGRIVDAVNARPHTDPPLAAVISDHGEGLGEHGEWAHGFFLYDATLHVPWILWSPGRVMPARVSAPVRTLDLAPTVLDAIGLPVPAEWAGTSCVGLWTGEPEPPREVYAENWFTRVEYGWSELMAWVTPEWKWVRAPRPELYDRTRDPEELRNLAGEEPGRAEEMARALAEFEARSVARAESVGVDGLVEAITPEPRVRDWLRNLGYVGGGGDVPPDAVLPDPKDEVPLWNLRRDARTNAGQGQKFLEAGDLPLALTAFERSVATMPTLEGLRGLGLTLSRMGRFEDAEPNLRAALELDPNDVETLRGVALTLDATGELAAADSTLTRATLLDSTDVVAWFHRGSLNRRLGRDDPAADCYERVLRMEPDHANALEEYASFCLDRGRNERAVALYERLTTLRPWDPVARWRLGRAQVAAGDTVAGAATLREARRAAGRGALRDSIDAVLRDLPDE